MYDEDDEEQVQRIEIPKYRVLHMDLDLSKKDSNGETINTGERVGTMDEKKAEEKKPNYFEKILECMNSIYLDAALSIEESQFDKDIASKLKCKLDEDKEMNMISVSNAESKYY